MIHSRLVDFLNKHTILQGMLCVLPIVFCITYMIAFFVDFSTIYGTAVENNSVVESTTNSENLIEVNTYEVKKDKYFVNLVINEKHEIDNGTSYLYGVYYLNEDWLKVILPKNEVILVPHTEFKFIDSIRVAKDNIIKIKIEDEEYNGLGTLLFRVYSTSEDGKYQIDVDDGNYSFITEIDNLKKEKDKYIYHVKYGKTIEANDLAYCYNHFNNGKTYYDVRVNQCIKDLDDEVIKTFIRESNLVLFLIGMIGYLIVLCYFKTRTNLKLINRKILIVNTIVIGLLPILFYIPRIII